MSVTVRTCAYDGARYRMGDACPTCGARHSTADVALERLRVPQQIDLDGGLHDLQPQTRQERLFEPAPFAQLDGQQHLDTDERHETSR